VLKLKIKIGRIYPYELIEREVNNFQPMILNHEALGELNHPPEADINPERACIRIESLIMDGDYAMGVARVLSTPMGGILKSLLEDECKLGVSSRGVGDMDGNIVSNNFHLITIDAVHQPSGINCYVDAIRESMEWVLDNKSGIYIEKIVPKYEQFNKDINKVSKSEIYNAVSKFIKSL
jgi:hypothetical protein